MPNNRFISMLIGLGMLSACSESDSSKRTAQNDNGADVFLHIDGGNGGNGGTVSLGIPGLDGKLSLPSLKLGKGDVDIDGVKLYPGSHVTGVDISGESGGSDGGVVIRFNADAKPDAVRDYYLQAFKDKGMKASTDGMGVSGTDSEGKPFRIDLTEQGSGTRGTIHVSQNDS